MEKINHFKLQVPNPISNVSMMDDKSGIVQEYEQKYHA